MRPYSLQIDVDPAHGPIPPHWHESALPRFAALKIGRFGTIEWKRGGVRGKTYVHRRDAETLWVTSNGASFPVPDKYAWAAPLWAELEAGAETPEARYALAAGMVPRLPCGECRVHWLTALREHPPETGTPAAFARWVRDRRNDIARRKGRPLLPLIGGDE